MGNGVDILPVSLYLESMKQVLVRIKDEDMLKRYKKWLIDKEISMQADIEAHMKAVVAGEIKGE